MAIDPVALDAFDQLFGVEHHKLNEALKRELAARVRSAAARGMLHSSSAAIQVVEAATASMPVRGQAYFNTMLRTLAAHGIAVSDDTLSDIKGWTAQFIKTEEERLLAELLEQPPLRDERHGMPKMAREKMHEAADLETRRLHGELQLIAAAQRTRVEHSAATTNMTFNAPVALVQTGAGSFGIANQVLDASALEALSKALDQVAADLPDDEDDLPSTEVREMIVQAKAELRKQKPNVSMLRAMASGIGSAIGFLPKMKAAYDTLKWAASFIGITLP